MRPLADYQPYLLQTLERMVSIDSVLPNEGPLAEFVAAALRDRAYVPTVVCGPKGGGHHGPGEWVDEASLLRVVEIHVETARRFLDPDWVP